MAQVANDLLSSYGTTIFAVMSQLAADTGAVNLGQGFPDVDGPEDLKEIAAEALRTGLNQYPSMMGIPELRQAIAAHNKRFYDLDVDWQTEVLVTSGATEAIANCCMALINPGDEVVLIEPLYDCYLPLVERAGGKAVSVRITPPDWKIDPVELEAAFSEKTKFVMLNSPMNPAGKVFNDEELRLVASLVEKYDCLAVCDEVYEHITFGENTHKPLMTYPKMRDRCVRIGSAGKSFSLTGWKIGYITASPNLLGAIAKSHQFLTFTTAPNLQVAVAAGLKKEDVYFNSLSADLAAKRDYLQRGLEALGFEVMDAEGTYFLTADIRPMLDAVENDLDDTEFCKKMTVEGGVAAVPVSAFYIKDAPTHFIRFCFCKEISLMQEALKRMAKYFGKDETQVLEAAATS